MQLSAVIITFNEERNIERCLLSLQGIADEIIVVDSLSTDKTEAICRKFDVKFYKQEWLGYSAQKNYANSLASFPMILSIDADEALSEHLRQSIRAIKAEDNSKAYSFNRLTNYCGRWIKHCGWYPDTKVRIFNKEIYWQGEQVHETLSIPPNMTIKHLKGDLLHFSYYSISEHLRQIDRFTDIAAAESKNNRRKPCFIGIIARSKWKFVRDYFFKLGFLDGKMGYQVCKLSSWATYIKYAKIYEQDS
ncbi:MAG: glycosyltransferase family 2 protein [Bacteroidales bacterium]|jgi:glycosyltransferase involved in cell wall biosynthesis|nr:glycosyltransferase family 2 protein [Bacteroidales bacterium]